MLYIVRLNYKTIKILLLSFTLASTLRKPIIWEKLFFWNKTMDEINTLGVIFLNLHKQGILLELNEKNMT